MTSHQTNEGIKIKLYIIHTPFFTSAKLVFLLQFFDRLDGSDNNETAQGTRMELVFLSRNRKRQRHKQQWNYYAQNRRNGKSQTKRNRKQQTQKMGKHIQTQKAVSYVG